MPGHWEGNLILGLESSAVGTRSSARPSSPCCCSCPAGKAIAASGPHGPALAGHGAEAVRDAIASAIATLPQQLRSLTWDQSAELARHARLRVDTGLAVSAISFCDPHSPWQRGTTRTPTACCGSTSPRAPT